jgi:hypothetical protein
MKSVLIKGFTAIVLGMAGLANATVYTTTLSGAAEATPNPSPGTGFATVEFDIATHMLSIDVTYSGLVGMTTNSHIHCCTVPAGTGAAGVATMTPTFAGFPAGDTFGTYSQTFDTSLASFWNAAYITANGGTTAGAEAALMAGLDSGAAYLNIHSTIYPGGEIRGFLQPVPEPATFALLALGAPLVLVAARRRRNKSQA